MFSQIARLYNNFYYSFSRKRYISAIALYIALDLLIYGYKPIIFGINHHCVGWEYNFNYFVWMLGWWKFAITHNINPLWTDYIWAGTGTSLSWIALLLPTYGILSFPFLYIFNPVEVANVILLLQPLLASLAAFALIIEITDSFSGSLIGGYIFGFSSYMTEEVVQSLPNNMTIFTIPLLALVIIKYVRGQISSKTLYFISALILIFQAGTFLEILLSMTIFLSTTLAISVIYYHNDDSVITKLIGSMRILFLSYITTAIVISPILYNMLVTNYYNGSKFGFFGISLISTIIPSKWNYFGYDQNLWNKSWNIGPWATTAYIGIPLLLIVSYFIISEKYKNYNILKFILLIFSIYSIGRHFYVSPPVHEIRSAIMPWYVTKFIPIIKDAQPHRFFVYCDIIIAIIIALYWKTDEYALRRNTIVAIACLSLLPTRHLLSQDINPLPKILMSHNLKLIIKKDQNVLIVSREFLSDAMRYQAEDKFYYKIAQGNSEGPGTTPSYKYYNSINNHGLNNIGKFIALHKVDVIVFIDQKVQEYKVKNLCYRELYRYGSMVCYTKK